MAPANPVLIEVSRGAAVESRHRGAAVVVDSRGGRRAAWGDVDAIVFPRSSVKPLQALPLLENGAAARAWLARLGRREEDLICGPHPPISREAADALIRIGREPSPLHNNCSGKHLGFLTLAMHLGAPLNDYGHPEHPVQREVRRVLSEMGGTDLSSAPVAGDGCGAPVVAMPLVAIARAFALLAAPDDLPRARATAARRVVSA